MWKAFLIAFVITAAVADVGWGKIPRKLTVLGFFCGVVYHLVRGGVVPALAAALLGFAGSMLLFQLGAIGGGDVKLITALGALLGLREWMVAMYVSVVAAGAMAVFQIVWHGAVRQTMTNLKTIVTGFGRTGLQAHPYLNVRNQSALRSPFGLAAAIGTLAALVMR